PFHKQEHGREGLSIQAESARRRRRDQLHADRMNEKTSMLTVSTPGQVRSRLPRCIEHQQERKCQKKELTCSPLMWPKNGLFLPKPGRSGRKQRCASGGCPRTRSKSSATVAPSNGPGP